MWEIFFKGKNLQFGSYWKSKLVFYLHQNSAISDKPNVPNPEMNERREFKIFSDILNIDITKTINKMMLDHLY